MTTTLISFSAHQAAHRQTVQEIWNAALGPSLPITERLVHYNLQQVTDLIQAGRLALADGRPVGAVLASAMPAHQEMSLPELGWVDLLAVAPEAQRRGVGSCLLAWAEGWLEEQGCRRWCLGGGMLPFAPGLPLGADLPTAAALRFLTSRGFVQEGTTWDVARDLHDYSAPSPLRAVAGTVRPAQPGQEAVLRDFLRRAFPGRWRFEYEEHLRTGGRISDYLLLWTDAAVAGFCQLTFGDSLRPLDRFYPYTLPRPWGQLGPIGVAPALRGQGYGAALLDAGLRRLHSNGVNGCVIDWTTLLDFYGKFGFTPYREYGMLAKETVGPGRV